MYSPRISTVFGSCIVRIRCYIFSPGLFRQALLCLKRFVVESISSGQKEKSGKKLTGVSFREHHLLRTFLLDWSWTRRIDRSTSSAIISESIRFSSPTILAFLHRFELVFSMSIPEQLLTSVNLLKVKFKSLPLYFNWHQVPKVCPWKHAWWPESVRHSTAKTEWTTSKRPRSIRLAAQRLPYNFS